jgi:hypothetical protein
MLVRIDANAPREAVKMALTFAAENGYAVDFRSFGPSVKSSKPEAVRQSETVRQSKTVRQPKAVKVKKVKKTPKAESKTPETLKEIAKSLRKQAESGETKLPSDVYADLRSKDVVKLKAAIKAASLLLNPEERWCDRDPSTLMMALRAHEEFMHGNPLLDAAK